MTACLRRSLLAIAVVSVVSMAPRAASAHIVTLNPGVKLGYTFGPGGGWTYGGEIAVTWMEPEIDWIIGSGAVLDLTWTKGGIFEVRAGYEVYGLLYGIEVGPALVVGPDRTYLAIDVTPWLGFVFVDPYYTMSFGLGGPSRSELGTYLKLPICLHDDEGCYDDDSGSSGDWDWD
jgi:hypothetical protein